METWREKTGSGRKKQGIFLKRDERRKVGREEFGSFRGLVGILLL
jgi:hypothetical protein